MKHLLFCTLLAAVCFTDTQAQSASASISGKVQDENGKPLADFPVMLLKASDSSLVKLEASNAAGEFRFDGLPAEKFLVKAEGGGLTAQFSPVSPVTDPGNSAPLVVTLRGDAAKSIGEVAVRAQKPLIEVRTDKQF
jgi:hypothetical protein